MPRAICRALGKAISECQRRHSAKKSSRQRRCSVDGAFAECRQLGHSAKTFFIFFQKLFAECRGGKALGKDIFYFFKKNSFPSATAARTRQSHFLIFFKKLFAECLPSLALGKDFLLFLKKNLCRVQCPGTRQSFPALPSAMTIALGKSTEIAIFFIFLHSTNTNSSNIYHMSHIYHKHHIYITTKPFSHIISQPQLK